MICVEGNHECIGGGGGGGGCSVHWRDIMSALGGHYCCGTALQCTDDGRAAKLKKSVICGV